MAGRRRGKQGKAAWRSSPIPFQPRRPHCTAPYLSSSARAIFHPGYPERRGRLLEMEPRLLEKGRKAEEQIPTGCPQLGPVRLGSLRSWGHQLLCSCPHNAELFGKLTCALL